MDLVKTQAPLIWVWLKYSIPISLCDNNRGLRFSVRGFGCAPFLYGDGRNYEQEHTKKGNRRYRHRAYARQAHPLPGQRKARL